MLAANVNKDPLSITTVANSGKDVPIANIEIPIIVSSSPNEVNILRELSKKTLPPIKIPKNDIINFKYVRLENLFFSFFPLSSS